MDAHASPIWTRLWSVAEERGAGLWQLLDPEKIGAEGAAAVAARSAELGCDAFLIGASTCAPGLFADAVQAVKRTVHRPVVIFPNGAGQVVPAADAILFLSLLSGRNPEYLVGEQVRGAPQVEAYGLEAIPTGYLLIESGHRSTVEVVSGTRPLPRHRIDLAYAHALAARYMGMRLIYLEAGSGAAYPVPVEIVKACAAAGLPLCVGGGIREPAAAAERVAAGARFIVVGTRFEPEPDWGLFREFVDAVHGQTPVQN